MSLTGKSLIAGQWLAEEGATSYQAYSPLDDNFLSQEYFYVSEALLNQACEAADVAFYQYAETTNEQRANFLDTIAEQILELGDELLEVTHLETALPIARLTGERGRTMNQLKLFAQKLREGLDMTIAEQANPDRQPLPKPETTLEYLPVGPVAVFGASNFPYAFSVPGGDTAAALAAGCPVVAKGHPAHPGTSELMAKAIAKAVEMCDMPAGVFSMIQSAERAVSHQLVMHPAMKAVGFTGSFTVASSLQSSIDKRAERIPLYGELGSINPQVVLEQKGQQEAASLAETLVQSLVLGQGQFCTNPGLWLVPESCQELLRLSGDAVRQQAAGPLLTKGILSGYRQGVERLNATANVECLGSGLAGASHHVSANLFKTDAQTFIANHELHEEVFGPCGLVVTYKNAQELTEIIDSLTGQLTASILATEDELGQQSMLINQLKYKVGRLIFNQMPTGVEVCYSMNHGGPFPATTDVRSTSVGTEAMKRFLRPICYQR